MSYPFKKKPSFDLTKPQTQQEFIRDAQDPASLLRKELEINLAEQTILIQRMQIAKEYINSIPSSDPQYSQLVAQCHSDQIELDELKIRQDLIIQKLDSPKPKASQKPDA